MWLVGCAQGSVTQEPAGAGGAGTGGAASPGAGGEGGAGGGPGAGGSGGAPGLGLGADCLVDADCASGLCKAVLLDTDNHVCVAPCVQQSDCGSTNDFFCAPTTADAADGYCVPRSPAHCLSCASDAECGSLSEVCFLAPGDAAKACHVDCAIAGDAACPADYACTDQMVNGQARKLCRPKSATTCLDALGGYCDRLPMARPCARESAEGTCAGTRECLTDSGRFDACNAAAPQCKALCSTPDPTGCMLSFCADAATTPDNCGTCGNVCPGLGASHANVGCKAGGCTFSCQGEFYDVDKVPGTGCEHQDVPLDNHKQTKATDKGSLTCFDNISDPAIQGVLLSDTRAHEGPAVDGFDATRGYAPDWYHIAATGGFGCTNDISLTLQVLSSSAPTCYRLRVITSSNTFSVNTNTSGTATVTGGSGAYASGSDLWIAVEKTCGLNVYERVDYTVTGHL